MIGRVFYINNILVDENHNLFLCNEDLWFLKLSEQYGFESKDVEFIELKTEDSSLLNINGGLPININDLVEKYN